LSDESNGPGASRPIYAGQQIVCLGDQVHVGFSFRELHASQREVLLRVEAYLCVSNGGVAMKNRVESYYEQGVCFIGEPQTIREWYTRCVYFRDPEDNLFEICQDGVEQ